VTFSPAEYSRASTAFQQAYIRSLMNNDWVEAVGGGIFRLGPLPALKVAFRLMRGEGRFKALMQRVRKRYDAQKGAVTIPVEVEVESFRRVAFLQKGHGSSGIAKRLSWRRRRSSRSRSGAWFPRRS
jgi:hypothetical protein